jgi:hypothetical protein
MPSGNSKAALNGSNAMHNKQDEHWKALKFLGLKEEFNIKTSHSMAEVVALLKTLETHESGFPNLNVTLDEAHRSSGYVYFTLKTAARRLGAEVIGGIYEQEDGVILQGYLGSAGYSHFFAVILLIVVVGIMVLMLGINLLALGAAVFLAIVIILPQYLYTIALKYDLLNRLEALFQENSGHDKRK